MSMKFESPVLYLDCHSALALRSMAIPALEVVWILCKPHPVLLQHLSIERFTAIPSVRESYPVAEDAFCDSLKKIGATWWRSLPAAERDAAGYPDGPDGLLPDHVFTGWPKNGGVWVLQVKELEYLSSRLGMLAMAVDMDEYCKVLETNGPMERHSMKIPRTVNT